ncbi:MAG: polysaccharide deacetylase family protein [Myxococcota bacterium]
MFESTHIFAAISKKGSCAQITPAKIALWYGGAQAATSLTFDDALPSQYKHLVPLLGTFGFRATFFLNTEQLLKKRKNAWNQSIRCWPQWQRVYDLGHELGSHTVNHPDMRKLSRAKLQSELRDSCRTIFQFIPKAECFTLAYPYGASNRFVRKETQRWYLAARAAKHRVASHTPRDMMNIPSVTPFRKTSRTKMLRWIRQSLRRRGWLVWMFHGTRGQGWEALPLSTYRFIFRQLQQRQSVFWNAPFGEIAKYISLRRRLRLSHKKTAQGWSIQIRWRSSSPQIKPRFLRQAWSTTPLTLMLRIPQASRRTLRIQQAGKAILPLKSRIRGCRQQIWFNVRLSKEPISIALSTTHQDRQ